MDWRKLERAVDKLERKSWGEQVRLSFFKGAVADPDRPQTVVRAILHTGGDDSLSMADGLTYRTRLNAKSAELFLTRDEYSGPEPRVGDKVRALDRDGQPIWEVGGVSDRYSNLWVLSLRQA